jgi:hypothetical protein
MKKLVGYAVAGALLAGFQTAQAQPKVPSSGATDLWLYVSDQTAKTSFAVDTGVTVSSLLNTFTANAVLQPVNDSISLTEHMLSSTDALSAYLKTTDTLEWTVLGLNWPSGSSTISTNEPPGATVGLLSSSLSTAPGSVKSMQVGNLIGWASGFNPDQGYVILGGGYVAGGATYAFTSGGSSGNVWGSGQGLNGAGSTTEYGNGPDAGSATQGTSETLFGVTGNGTTGALQSYVLGSLKLGTDGSLTLTNAQVPLPAALWLFGSGLLGLAGVGRRRSATPA